jgi:dTDP-4-amino-4,6-dideoxygalactose transaminase
VIHFNNLSHIHIPLLSNFQDDLEEAITNSDFVLGQSVVDLELNLAIKEKINHVVTVSTGTAAIELVLRALNVDNTSKVIIPSMTFAATAFAPSNIGAKILVCDIDLDTGNMDANQLSMLLNDKISAVIFVALHGRLDGLEDIATICSEHNVPLIVDGAQSQGTFLNDKSIGDYCQAYTLSFYPGKNLGALGEGGAVCTNSELIAADVRKSRNWGSSTDRYHSQFWGGNFRLPSLQARFLNTKLKYLTDWVYERRKIATEYEKNLPKEIQLRKSKDENNHSYHIYGVLVNNRDAYIREFEKLQIGCGLHYPRAIPDHEYYRSRVSTPLGYTNAKIWGDKELSLPIYPGLKIEEIKQICETISYLA